MMAELQAEIELTIELKKFVNIDLFVQGFYQIRTGVKFATRIQSATKIEIQSEIPPTIDDSNPSIYPACIFNDSAVSKTFLIIFKNEEVELDDQFNFKLSVIVDAENIEEYFNRLEMQLFVDLYFLEKDYSAEKMSQMQQLCSRCFKLHFNPRTGLHTHLPILFDYFHLSALTTTIHGSLLCLIPPYVFDRPDVRRTSLFSFLFGQDLSQINTEQINPTLLQRAYQLHNQICEILLSSYESLQDFFETMIEHRSENAEKPIHVHQNCRQKLRNLSEKLQTIDDIHTIDNLAHAHIAQCSAENIMLWCQFIQTFGLDDLTATILAKDYYFKRIKRFSEGFFLRERSRQHQLINEGDSYNEFHELIRSSAYYSRLPALPIECLELDGIPETLPIIIEEIYSSIEEKSFNSGGTTKSKSSSNSHDHPFFQAVQNFSKNLIKGKFRTNFGLCLGTSMDETVFSSFTSNPPATPPLKSKKTDLSTPKVRQSGKTLLSFRNPTPTNVNRIVALNSDPSVQLTSFRKVDSTNSPRLSSSRRGKATIEEEEEDDPKSNNTPSTGLVPHQSDSDLIQNLHGSRLTKQASRHSLPEGPLERSEIFSPNSDEDLFLSNEHDKVMAASTFGDSSMKSKVLQASFRGKTSTMDRRNGPITPNRSQSKSNGTRQVITTTSTATTNNGPINCSLDSVLNLTLQFEQQLAADYQRRQTLAVDSIDPMVLNGLTHEENEIHAEESDRIQTISPLETKMMEHLVLKEKIKQSIPKKYLSNLTFYSDCSATTCSIPYFNPESLPFDSNGVHLIICVHGLDGNSGDLRLVKTYLELSLPTSRLDFLMSSANHSSTFDDIEIMVEQLIGEIDGHIERYGLKPERISFVGHSLGNLVVRSTVSHPRFENYRTRLYTYLSLSGPHLGTLFNSSGLVNMGMWLMQKWKKSCSLAQMSFKDHVDPKETFLYKLSKKPSLEFFKNILLISSPQDRYVPYHSARIEICKAALKDNNYGSIYVEMVNNILEPILRNTSIQFVRYNAFHQIPSGTNHFIGRAAHIAILDSELFVEKLILVSAAKYFQ